jgi:hypothetical protein
MRQPGYAVVVRTQTRGTAVVALRTSELGTLPGKRGSTDRPRNVTLARKRKQLRPGRNVLRLRVGPRTAAKLRARRATRARLTVQVRDQDGTVQLVTRRVKVVRRRRRARRR